MHPEAGRVPSTALGDLPASWSAAVTRAREAVRAAVVEQNLPGISVAVGVRGELVWAEGFGWADLEGRVPVKPDTRFRLGTASTALTSAAIGLLLEKGSITQEEFDADPAAAAHAVTVNHAGAVSVGLAVAARFRAQGHGRLVVLSSVAGERVRKANFVYGSSKAGLDGFAQSLGDALAGARRNADAEAAYTRAVALAARSLPADHPEIARVKLRYGALLLSEQRFGEAESLLVAGFEIRKKSLGVAHASTKSAAADLVRLYDAWRRPDKAAIYQPQGSALAGAAPGKPQS